MHNAARMAVWFRVALIPDGVYAVARIRTSGDLDQALVSLVDEAVPVRVDPFELLDDGVVTVLRQKRKLSVPSKVIRRPPMSSKRQGR
jgi:hypothetical protein